jgi:hypothetical protein
MAHSIKQLGNRMDTREVVIGGPVGSKFSSFPKPTDLLWSPPRLLFSGNRGLFRRGINWTSREADHTHASSAEVRNERSSNSTSLFVFLACTGNYLQFTSLRFK